jgi:hypothetical protein
LDAAHDVMLERGRCQGSFEDPVSSRVCTLGAVNIADSGEATTCEISDTGWLARRGLHDAVLLDSETSIAGWNDDPATTDDMAFDAFRTAAKELRERAGQQ